MNVNKIKVMDWLAHGGHQYEFFKTGPSFYCTTRAGIAPNFSDLGRPKNSNVEYIDELFGSKIRHDIIMVRLGLNPERYRRFLMTNPKAAGIAVIQTHSPFPIPRFVKSVVWNSITAMNKHFKSIPNKKHYYIPHGFDPNEFKFLNLERNDKILSVYSAFKQRAKHLGYEEWRWVADQCGKCELMGHSNDEIPECIGSFQLNDLVIKYNSYPVLLNTTTASAMPRSRGEALMCGTPIVTTNNYDIGGYLKHGVNCMFANTREEMLNSCKAIIQSRAFREDLSLAGREAALKYFHISKYIEKWQQVFQEALE